MSICVILSVFALGLLLFILFSERELITNKEGFTEYIVYGPPPWWGGWWGGPWRGGRRPWWRRHWRTWGWPRREMWFY